MQTLESQYQHLLAQHIRKVWKQTVVSQSLWLLFRNRTPEFVKELQMGQNRYTVQEIWSRRQAVKLLKLNYKEDCGDKN